PFEAFVDGILTTMPPPVSHVRHFHWLPQVRNYRYYMIRADGRIHTDLLDDPRNTFLPTWRELVRKNAATGGFSRNLLRCLAEQAMIILARPSHWVRRVRQKLTPLPDDRD